MIITEETGTVIATATATGIETGIVAHVTRIVAVITGMNEMIIINVIIATTGIEINGMTSHHVTSP